MKKRAMSLFLTLAIAVSMAVVPASATEIVPAVSNNINAQHYFTWAATVKSYLVENQMGGLTRVEYIDGQIVAEDYSSDFQLQSSRTIPMELSIWGGFFAGERYNFFVFGQNNPNESDSVEVIRVVKYSKDWKRLGQASLYGANTTIPFRSGSLRCDEYAGKLYIRTSHQMYKSSDGLNHQASLTLCVDQEQMTNVMDTGVSYVSHSFSQFVLVDAEGYLVTLDHGDAYPRSAILMKYNTKAENWTSSGWISDTTIQAFPGKIGNNITGASLGGLAETNSGYVVAYNYIDSSSSTDMGRNVYIGYVPKGSSQETAVVRSISPDEPTSTPQLASTGPDGGYVLWNTFGFSGGSLLNDELYYVRYDSTGKAGGIQTATASLSDCQPIYYNGKVVWYTTKNSAPVFYTLDSTGVTAHPAGGSTVQGEQTAPSSTTDPTPAPTPTPSVTVSFSDVPATHWAYPYVSRAAENGWVSGMGNNKFAPNDTLTFAQFYTMVVPIFAADKLAEYEAPAGSPWWQPYMWVGARHLRANTIWMETFSEGPANVTAFDQKMQECINKHAEEPITRTDAISIMWRVLGDDNATHYIPGVDEALQKLLASGLELNMMEEDTVSVCYAAGLISGDESGNLNLNGTLTRAEGCTMLCSLVDYMLAHGRMTGTGNTIPFQLPTSSK